MNARGNTAVEKATVAQHTPGPWTYSGYFQGDHTPRRMDIRARGYREVCCVYRHVSDEPQGRAEANAALIAAAPELLAALETLMSWPSHENMTPAFDVARIAIAKARGGVR